MSQFSALLSTCLMSSSADTKAILLKELMSKVANKKYVCACVHRKHIELDVNSVERGPEVKI